MMKTYTKTKKLKVVCLYCKDDIFIGNNPKVGNFLTCDGCDSQFVIIDLGPIIIDWPYTEDEYVDTDDYYVEDERP